MKILTFEGCWRSKITVSPANWRTQKASLKVQWRIAHRFYDPAYKDTKHWGKQTLVKGMNDCMTLTERQAMTEYLLKKEERELDQLGFNPVTGKYMAPKAEEKPTIENLCLDTPFIRALELAIPYSTAAKGSKDAMWTTWRIFSQAAVRLGIQDLSIKDINRGMIIDALEACRHSTKISPRKKDNGKRIPIEWNDNQYNFLRAHLGMIYAVLKTRQLFDYNIVHAIPKKHIIDEEGEEEEIRLLTADERRIVIDELRHFPEFLRFIQIFFPSGGRLAEFCRVKGKHVRLEEQRFRVLVKKRQRMAWEWKTITNLVLPYWQEIMKNCRPEDYIFSLDLIPGPKQIHPAYLTRRWKRHIKEKHDIDVDLYKLKHLFDSEVIDQETAFHNARKKAVEAVAAHNNHTSTEMVESVYDAKKEAREHEFRKTLGKPFA